MPNATVTADAWDVFASYYQTHCNEWWCGHWERCSSIKYQEYYKSLPELSLADFRVPPNVRILFYGTSLLKQIEDYILLANLHNEVLNDQIDIRPNGSDKFCWAWKWKSKINSTIVHIENCGDLQRSTQADELKFFLEEHGPFDIGFFMSPHADCFWDDSRLCTEAEENRLPQMPGSEIGSLWAVVKDAVRGNTYEVEAWNDAPMANWRGFRADDDFLIRTTPTLKGHACNTVDECQSYPSSTEGLQGHQCQPGRVAFIAKSLMANVHDP